MRLWRNRTGQVSLREQLITQVELGILGGEMLPGERLPSTRELARRLVLKMERERPGRLLPGLLKNPQQGPLHQARPSAAVCW